MLWRMLQALFALGKLDAVKDAAMIVYPRQARCCGGCCKRKKVWSKPQYKRRHCPNISMKRFLFIVMSILVSSVRNVVINSFAGNQLELKYPMGKF